MNVTKIKHFKDEHTIIQEKEEYSMLNNAQKTTLLTTSSLSRSEIGNNFKSANCGVLFGESNLFGTDSVAFGGLLK